MADHGANVRLVAAAVYTVYPGQGPKEVATTGAAKGPGAAPVAAYAAASAGQPKAKAAVTHDHWTYYYLQTRTAAPRHLLLVAVAAPAYPPRLVMQFFALVQSQLARQVAARTDAPKDPLKGLDVKGLLKSIVAEYAHGAEMDKAAAVAAELENVRDAMRTTLDRTLARGESVERLDHTVELLTHESEDFTINGKALHTTVKHQRWRLWFILGLGAVAVIVALSAVACGGITYPNCRIADHSGSSDNSDTSHPSASPSAPH
jgi:hypothetical protein